MPSLPSPLAEPARPRRAEAIFGGVRCASILRGRELEGAEPEESLLAAVNRMWWRQVGALPVVSGGRLVGCLAEEDLLRILAERTRVAQASAASLSVWEALLRGARVRDAMTHADELPRVAPDTPLLEGLRRCTAPDRPRGRYLFVVEEAARGQRIQLASYRDVALYLSAL